MTIPDPSTDTATEGGSFGFLGSLIGLDKFEQQLFDRLEILMATLDAANAALDRASTALGTLGTQTTQLAQQIAALAAGSIPQSQIDALVAKAEGIADGITAAAGAVDAAYEPDEGEEVPPPVEEPPVEPNP